MAKYKETIGRVDNIVMSVKNNVVKDVIGDIKLSGRTILKGGLVVDPKNNIEEVKDIVIYNGEISEVGDDIKPEKGDKVVNCEEAMVIPGLIDMHLHLGDNFETDYEPAYEAPCHGVTIGLSPGAGNTLMVPCMFAGDIDRGLPVSGGVYIGAAAVLGTRLSTDELIKLFKGELDIETASEKMTRNAVTYATAPFTIGIKDHMGHFISTDEEIDSIFEITSKAKLLYMTHTQDPEHAQRVVGLSKGRPCHLAHATAAGCGPHKNPVEAMQTVIDLCKEDGVSAEFVTTMLRASRGSHEGLLIDKKAQDLAYKALEDGIVDILVSDGQNAATMKGFGDTRDNIPALIELVDMGVLSLSESIATMTSNPAKLMADRFDNPWWTEKVGHLGEGAIANIAVIKRDVKKSHYTFVNGELTAFEGRVVRRGMGAGGFISKFGQIKRTGVGEFNMFSYIK